MLYKTVWEIKQKCILDMAADRGKYIDQSQSLNIFIAEPSYKLLTSMHFYGWRLGLKTGMYYLRSKPAANPIQFTLSPELRAGSADGGDDNDNEAARQHTSGDPADIVCESCSG